MLGFPDRVHADGHGRVLRLARLSQRQPADSPCSQVLDLLVQRTYGGDVERRADRDSAVRVHGLSRRARAADRPAVQEPAPRHRARAGLARGGDHRHLRDLRHRDRHRRRGGDADGPARVSGDAQGRLQRQGLGRRDHRRRLPRHPDPAVGAADRLRRDRRRVGGAALRRRVLSRLHAGVPVHRLRHRAREVEAAASCRRCPRASGACRCRPMRRRWQRAAATRLAASWRALVGQRRARRRRNARVFAQFLVSLLPALCDRSDRLASLPHRRPRPKCRRAPPGLVEAGGAIAADASAVGAVERPDRRAGRGSGPRSSRREDSWRRRRAPKPTKKPAAEAAPAPVASLGSRGRGGRTRCLRRPGSGSCSAVGIGAVVLIYWLWNWERLEVFKMLLTSFFPLALLILAVLGSIVFGLATPTEAAAVGAFGGFMLAGDLPLHQPLARAAARQRGRRSASDARRRNSAASSRNRRSSPPRRARWCAGCSSARRSSRRRSRCSAARSSSRTGCCRSNMTPVQFMILAQFIIFILGWPLEWTEIIVIFMPIFIPLLPHFGIDPLFFGLLVALNLQTAFLSPPVAMAAFYLKGVSPPHVTLNQIFAGMMPFMGIQVIALILLYIVPADRAVAAERPVCAMRRALMLSAAQRRARHPRRPADLGGAGAGLPRAHSRARAEGAGLDLPRRGARAGAGARGRRAQAHGRADRAAARRAGGRQGHHRHRRHADRERHGAARGPHAARGRGRGDERCARRAR